MLSAHERAADAATAIRRADLSPRWGVVLGSGFAGFAGALSDATATPFTDIPHMPPTTVPGHRGVVHQGLLDQTPLAIIEGRLHTYEGHAPDAATFPIRLLAALGVTHLLLTNAAGGLRRRHQPGALMLITDHINLPALTGQNPLRGPDEGKSPPFVAMRDAYDPQLRAAAKASAARLSITLHEGVYAMVTGPSYETPAEVRFLRVIGADAVGMSTAGEVIVARRLGLRVLGISCIANVGFGGNEGDVHHDDVLAVVREQAPTALRLFRDLLAHA